MKILILTHNYPIDAQERRNAGIFVHDFAKELVKNGVDVHVFCPSASSNKKEIEGIPVHWFKWGKKNRTLKTLKFYHPLDLVETFIFFWKGINESLKLAREIKPDICISMWAVPSGVFAYIIKKKLGVPYSVWALGSDIYVYSKLPILGVIIQIILKGARHLLADSIDLAHQVKKIGGRNCLFLPSGTAFEPTDKIEKPTLKNNKIVLTFLGRMEPEKGPDLLVEALLKLKNKISQYQVNFLGDGSLLKQLEDKISKNGLAPHVKFYGNVDDQRKIASVLSNSQWVVIPSRSDSIPLVFSEAMKMGVPVIAAKLPDLKYLIDRYKVGLYFKPDNENSLFAIIDHLSGAKMRNNFDENTKQAAEFFNLEISAQKLLQIIYDRF